MCRFKEVSDATKVACALVVGVVIMCCVQLEIGHPNDLATKPPSFTAADDNFVADNHANLDTPAHPNTLADSDRDDSIHACANASGNCSAAGLDL